MMQAFSAVLFPVYLLCGGCDVEEAFRTEEVSCLRAGDAFCEVQGCGKVMRFRVGAEGIVQRAAFRVEAVGDGERLYQRGFSRTVLADEKGYRVLEGELIRLRIAGMLCKKE